MSEPLWFIPQAFEHPREWILPAPLWSSSPHLYLQDNSPRFDSAHPPRDAYPKAIIQ